MARPKDENYIVDICDNLLELKASRGHRFAFLRGDPGKNGIHLPLPVDAYYPELNLVVEYHEHQHFEDVALFNRRIVSSGITRGEQRRKYDLRRNQVLPQNGITLVEFAYHEFQHDARKRLRRVPSDRDVVQQRLWSLATLLSYDQLGSSTDFRSVIQLKNED